MKKYIILTPSICHMGGNQMYVSNKCLYLESQGWNVSIFHFDDSEEILIGNLERFRNNCIPSLRYGFYYLSKKQRNANLIRLCDGITLDDEVVVESQIFSMVYWGEMLAKKVNGTHILNCVEESISQVSDAVAKFLEYKLRRYEILNSSIPSLKRYFGVYYKEEYNAYENRIIPSCTNVVEDSSPQLYTFEESDYTILSIGRLDKPYIQDVIQQLDVFFRDRKQLSFNLIVIGGSPKGNIEAQINKMFSGYSNVKLYLLGYLFPIPTYVIKKADVSIASSNSVLVSSSIGIPTISYDISDHLPIGVYGYTTENFKVRKDEKIVNLQELLTDVLIKKKYPPKIFKGEAGVSMEEALKPQLDYLNKGPRDNKYYDIISLFPWYVFLYSNLKRIYHQMQGNWKS